LNFPQRPDGTLDEENLAILKSMADWISVNGEGIYGTRPWKQAMEGPSRVVSGHFKEDAVAWTTADFRFTKKENRMYAFQMKCPEHRETFIRSLGLASGSKVLGAKLLGHADPIAFRQLEEGLLVILPEHDVPELVPCIRVELG
jgi:alpha-L-fucosidase